MNQRHIKFRAWDQRTEEMFDPMPIMDFEILRLNAIVLMQFTGLRDRTGVEIYDGDIVESATGRDRYVVYWDHSGWFRKSIVGTWRISSLYIGSKWQTIIGNIYEHPHLMISGKNVQESDTTGDDSKENAGTQKTSE